MPEHPGDDRLTTAPQRPGLDNNPLRMLRRHVVFETTDLLLLGAQQPTFTLFWWVSVDKRAVLVWHDATMAKQ